MGVCFLIYITGDTHGELKKFKEKQMRKLKKGDTLIICGDFGFIWDGSKHENKTLNTLSKLKFRILFLDGTHENFNLLNKYPIVDFCKGKAQQICENIYHLLRGEIYEIERKKIFTFGGGESQDKDIRKAMGTWFKEEMPSESEMDLAIEKLLSQNNKVDYIITHEPTIYIKSLITKDAQNINRLDAFFDKLSKNVTYRKWFFGSLHLDKKITAKHYAVFCDVIPIEPIKKAHRFK